MAEDRIIVDIESQIDMEIAKLQQAISLSTMVLGSPSVQKGISAVKPGVNVLQQNLAQVAQSRDLLDRMPAINRELRILLGQIPGMREAIPLYFRTRRLARGIDIGGLQLYLTVMATAVILLKYILEGQRRMERRQQQYEAYIRRERNLSTELWRKEKDYWMSYVRSSPP